MKCNFWNCNCSCCCCKLKNFWWVVGASNLFLRLSFSFLSFVFLQITLPFFCLFVTLFLNYHSCIFPINIFSSIFSLSVIYLFWIATKSFDRWNVMQWHSRWVAHIKTEKYLFTYLNANSTFVNKFCSWKYKSDRVELLEHRRIVWKQRFETIITSPFEYFGHTYHNPSANTIALRT